uniref:Palmitoyltransferase n=1 Tax=Steinernema glaseri TaxID=37863 RepID=A0A1I8A5T9_9BILA
MTRYSQKTNCCGRKWCVKDACGLVCAVLTWLLMFYGEFSVVSVMLGSISEYPIHQSVNFVLFQVLLVLAFSSHIRTMLTDPGAVPKGNATDDYVVRIQMEHRPGEVLTKCSKCDCIKPERAHHCSVCERCIRRMDHHCPWVNNCVGEGNQKYFVLFTFYIALLSIHAVYWAIWQFMLCVSDEWRSCPTFSPPVTTIVLVFLIFEGVLFSIFTMVMFGTQISAICSDQTGIESLKREREELQTDKWKNVQLVFGGPFSHRWFIPFSRPFVSKYAFEFSV